MRALPDIDTASLVLSSLILAITAALGWAEWRARVGRGDDLSADDRAHYRRQDGRRVLGLLILVLLAVGLFVGSRVPVRAGMRANPNFVSIWLGVFGLILALLWLALADWVALRRFAGRHRKAIFRERIELLRRDLALRDEAGRNGDLDDFD